MTLSCYTLRSTETDFAHCVAIRTAVFVDEQHVPPDEELDDLDSTAMHVLARLDEEPVGTARLILESGVTARIGRMAVLRAHRQSGIGSVMLQHLTDLAFLLGVRSLTLAGQLHAIPFYERHGFVARGEVFLDAGIEHRWMDKIIGRPR